MRCGLAMFNLGNVNLALLIAPEITPEITP
jgi:hypothetical protein